MDEDEEVGTEAAHEFDWESDDNPYKKRFSDYRSEADRRQTEFQQTQALLNDLQSDDPATQRAAAQSLGLDFVDEETGPEEVEEDPRLAQLIQRQEELERKLAEKDQREQEALIAQTVDQRLDALGLDKDDGDWVLARAVALPPAEDGLPDLQAAYEQWQAKEKAIIERYRGGKRTTVTPKGRAGNDQKDLLSMTDEERINYIMEQHEMA